MIVVTAATGKTGRAIIRAAAAAGLPIRAVVDSEGARATIADAGAAEAVVADLLVPARVRARSTARAVADRQTAGGAG